MTLRLPRPALALSAVALVVGVYGTLAVRRIFLALPKPARASLIHAVAGPVAEWRFGSTRDPETGPSLPAELDGKTSQAALQDALAHTLPGRKIGIVDFENPLLVRSQFEFAWQDPADPALDALIERLGLAKFRDISHGEVEMFRALASHLRNRAPHLDLIAGRTIVDVGQSANEILDHVDAGNTLTCYYYSLLLVQSLAALGWPSRLVGSGPDQRDWHATVEVFSHTHRKWMLVDTDYDLIYERDGAPLNAWDVHDTFMAGYAQYRRAVFAQDAADTLAGRAQYFREHPELTAGIAFLRGTVQAQRIPDMMATTEGGMLLGAYWTYSIGLRNDYLSVRYPPGHPRAAEELAMGDLGAGWLAEYDGSFTNRPGDLYFSVDTVQMAFEPGGEPGSLRVSLGTMTPGFAGFRVQMDAGQPVTQTAETLAWPLWPGAHTLKVWPVNRRGVEGSVSQVAVVYDTTPTPVPRP